MNHIKYPTGSNTWHQAKGMDGHAHRGTSLENDINDSNKYYRETDKALIYKKPTPIQVVKVDYPARNKAKITEAYFRTPSTTDYNGIYRGKYIDFEAKETTNKSGFPLYMVHDHQIRHLEKVSFHQGIGFFIIRFSIYQKTYLVDAMQLIMEMKKTTKSYVPLSWFEENAFLLTESFTPRLAYLKGVDEFYFKEEC